MRDTCYFEVKIGEEVWSRKCIHNSDCPKGPNACNFDSPKRIVCCCQQDYCNTYMEYAIQGYADPADAPEVNEKGKVVGSGGSKTKNDKDKQSKKSKAFMDYQYNMDQDNDYNKHYSDNNMMNLLVLSIFGCVAVISLCGGLYLGSRIQAYFIKERQLLPQ